MFHLAGSGFCYILNSLRRSSLWKTPRLSPIQVDPQPKCLGPQLIIQNLGHAWHYLMAKHWTTFRPLELHLLQSVDSHFFTQVGDGEAFQTPGSPMILMHPGRSHSEDRFTVRPY